MNGLSCCCANEVCQPCVSGWGRDFSAPVGRAERNGVERRRARPRCAQGKIANVRRPPSSKGKCERPHDNPRPPCLEKSLWKYREKREEVEQQHDVSDLWNPKCGDQRHGQVAPDCGHLRSWEHWRRRDGRQNLCADLWGRFAGPAKGQNEGEQQRKKLNIPLSLQSQLGIAGLSARCDPLNEQGLRPPTHCAHLVSSVSGVGLSFTNLRDSLTRISPVCSPRLVRETYS